MRLREILPISSVIISTFMSVDTLESNLEELTENILHLNTNKNDDWSTQSLNTIDLDN